MPTSRGIASRTPDQAVSNLSEHSGQHQQSTQEIAVRIPPSFPCGLCRGSKCNDWDAGVTRNQWSAKMQPSLPEKKLERTAESIETFFSLGSKNRKVCRTERRTSANLHLQNAVASSWLTVCLFDTYIYIYIYIYLLIFIYAYI